jgi:hypothetical protein
LIYKSFNPYFPLYDAAIFSTQLTIFYCPEFGSSRLFLNVSNCLQLK